VDIVLPGVGGPAHGKAFISIFIKESNKKKMNTMLRFTFKT
jgi:hypothetical protein